jgi:hypothetical protein
MTQPIGRTVGRLGSDTKSGLAGLMFWHYGSGNRRAYYAVKDGASTT